MRSAHTIMRSAGTSAVALFLVAGAALATSSVVGTRPPAADPVNAASASVDPTDTLETADPSADLETEEPTDALETEGPTASAEDENEVEDATDGPSATPEHEDATFDDHGGARDIEDDQGGDAN